MIDTKGSVTAKTGYLSEFIIKAYIDKYIEEYKETEDHNASVESIQNILFVDQFSESVDDFGFDEYSIIEDNSKIAAIAAINHIYNKHNLEINESHHTGTMRNEDIQKLTGKKSNADIIIKGNIRRIKKFAEYIGSSLKYSKTKKTSSIKIYSPTINTLITTVEKYGKDLELRNTLNDIANKGLAEQYQASLPVLNELRKIFVPGLRYNNRPATCSTDGYLSRGAISYLRDSKNPEYRSYYEMIAAKNREMKVAITKELAESIKYIINHVSLENKVKFLREISNIRDDNEDEYLKTFILSTVRQIDNSADISIYDIDIAFSEYVSKNNFEVHHPPGTATIRVGLGELRIDCRPTHTKNPLSYPVNYYVSKSSLQIGKYETH